MKTNISAIALILTILMAAVSTTAQVTTLKNDISEDQYLAVETKAKELLKTANYRSVWTKDYFEDRSKAAKLNEKTLNEVLQPNKSHSIEEKFYEKPSREERLWDGKALYTKTNDEPWRKFGGGTSFSGDIESGRMTNRYRSLPSIDYEGGKADLYERISIRTANKFSRDSYIIVHYVTNTRTWYSLDGKVIKTLKETMIEGREEMIRETTTYEYDPKDLRIEAPIK